MNTYSSSELQKFVDCQAQCIPRSLPVCLPSVSSVDSKLPEWAQVLCSRRHFVPMAGLPGDLRSQADTAGYRVKRTGPAPCPPAYRVSKTAPVQGFSSASQCHFGPALVLARSKGGPVYTHPVGKSSDPCPASGPVPGAFESWRLPLTCSCSCRFLFFLSLFTSDHIFW